MLIRYVHIIVNNNVLSCVVVYSYNIFTGAERDRGPVIRSKQQFTWHLCMCF